MHSVLMEGGHKEERGGEGRGGESQSVLPLVLAGNACRILMGKLILAFRECPCTYFSVARVPHGNNTVCGEHCTALIRIKLMHCCRGGDGGGLRSQVTRDKRGAHRRHEISTP